MRISDQERREVAAKLRNGGIARDSKEAYTLLLSCVGIRPQLPATNTYEDAMVRLADLIDRPTCRNVYDEIYDEYEGAVVKTASSAASAEKSSRITRATASRGRSITARSAGERWWTDGRHAHMRPLRQANAELQ